MIWSSPGGIWLPSSKQTTASKTVESMAPPEKVVLPLIHASGSTVSSTVRKGDRVLMGQRVGHSERPDTAHVHASLSGTVERIESWPQVTGQRGLSIVIESDGRQEWAEGFSAESGDPIRLSAEAIRSALRESGLLGMGGAGFPTAVKLGSDSTQPAECLIINGSECEPYVTADERVMQDFPEDVILGIKLLAKACGAQRVVLAIEDAKGQAAALLKRHRGSDRIEIVMLPTKYPQGSEKQLVKTITGQEVPSKTLPHQMGILVQNVTTAWAAARIVRTGRPPVERVVTVTGPGVKEPGNYLVPIGTSLQDLIDAAGGFSGAPGKVIVGGPMMGIAQADLRAPVTQFVNGVVLLPPEQSAYPEPMACIKCARCVDVCPVYLLPMRIEAVAMNKRWDDAAELGAEDCIDCGCCTYICPSKRHLLHWIRIAKGSIEAAAGDID